MYVFVNGGNLYTVEHDKNDGDSYTFDDHYVVTPEGEVVKSDEIIIPGANGYAFYPTPEEALNLPQHIKDMIIYK